MPLLAPKWSTNQRLQNASNNKPAMRRGEPDQTAVFLLQETLIDNGFAIPDGATGNYFSQTAAAVRAVEERFNLKRDEGVAGKEVLGVLDSLLLGVAPNVPPPVGPPAPPPSTPTVQSGKALAQLDVPLARRKAGNASTGLFLLRGVLINRELGLDGPADAVTTAALRVHFRLLESGSPAAFQRRVTVQDLGVLIATYDRLLEVLRRNETTFEDGPTMPPHVAQVAVAGNPPIVFGPEYRGGVAPDRGRKGPNTRAAILIHEATHTVDNQSGNNLTTHLSEFDPRYETQPADFSMHNPSSYAAFAAHITQGTVNEPRPRFGLDGGPGQFL